jgi:HlyD family secretion protein
VTNSELSLKQQQSGARPEDIASARATLASANLNYENTIIRAPFAGQIGSVSAIVGQQTSTQTGVATIITKNKFAQVSLNEIDIVNVKLGQEVKLKLDAIPNVTFKGKVTQINTVGSTVSNVVTFGVKIGIEESDERLRSGMSITANIVTDKKENILTVPAGAVKTEEGKNGEADKFYVMKKPLVAKKVATSTDIIGITGTSTENSSSTKKSRNRGTGGVNSTAEVSENIKVFISTGVTNDIDTEVLEGLNEGEEVVIKTNDGTTAAKKPAATFSLFGGSGNRGGR